MKNILKLKEFPYLLTLLFTLLGWTFTKISDKITKLPTIEYNVLREQSADNNSTMFIYSLINLTDDRQFKNLGLRIEIDTADYESKIIKGILIATPPASRWTEEPYITSKQNEIQIRIPIFNPQSEYHLNVSFSGKIEKPILSVFYVDENQPETIILRKSSFFTFLVKNDLFIYSILFITLMTFIIFYLHHASKDNNKPKYY